LVQLLRPYATIDINAITMRAFVHRTRWANTPTTLVGKFSLPDGNLIALSPRLLVSAPLR